VPDSILEAIPKSIAALSDQQKAECEAICVRRLKSAVFNKNKLLADRLRACLRSCDPALQPHITDIFELGIAKSEFAWKELGKEVKNPKLENIIADKFRARNYFWNDHDYDPLPGLVFGIIPHASQSNVAILWAYLSDYYSADNQPKQAEILKIANAATEKMLKSDQVDGVADFIVVLRKQSTNRDKYLELAYRLEVHLNQLKK
jgi:hypothetical protein